MLNEKGKSYRKYVVGSKRDFNNFIDSLDTDKKIGIVTHTDVDGLISGFMLKKILESKKLNIDFIEFKNLDFNSLDFLFEKEIDVLFFTDYNLDSFEDKFKKLREIAKVFVIDHHPLNENINDRQNMIKTKSHYCSAHVLYDLSEEYLDNKEFKELKKLADAAIILDYCFVDEGVFEYLKKDYPELKKEKIFESLPGKFGKKINNALIYFKPDYKKVFDLVLENNFSFLEEISGKVEKDIKDSQEKYFRVAEHHKNKCFYFAYDGFKINSAANILSEISHRNPKDFFVLVLDVEDKQDFVKVSGRAQDGKINVGELFKNSVKGFENASAGGHFKAAGASFPKKYVPQFRDNLLESLD